MSGRSRPPTDELAQRLALNMRRIRKGLGISQEEVSFRSETGLSTVHPIEQGDRLPKIDTFIRLAGALETTPGELTEGILWTPAELILTPGGFEVPEDPELEAEVAALRGAAEREAEAR